MLPGRAIEECRTIVKYMEKHIHWFEVLYEPVQDACDRLRAFVTNSIAADGCAGACIGKCAR
ncbi:hypothetical protein D3C80_2200690 [compost metagenome]